MEADDRERRHGRAGAVGPRAAVDQDIPARVPAVHDRHEELPKVAEDGAACETLLSATGNTRARGQTGEIAKAAEGAHDTPSAQTRTEPQERPRRSGRT
eukprot:4342723-Alexandrium_andersonii.AAC.1